MKILDQSTRCAQCGCWTLTPSDLGHLSVLAPLFCCVTGCECGGLIWDQVFSIPVCVPSTIPRSVAPHGEWGTLAPGEHCRSKARCRAVCKQTSARHWAQINPKIRAQQTCDEILPGGAEGEGASNPKCPNIFIIKHSVSVTCTHEAMEMPGPSPCHMF